MKHILITMAAIALISASSFSFASESGNLVAIAKRHLICYGAYLHAGKTGLANDEMKALMMMSAHMSEREIKIAEEEAKSDVLSAKSRGWTARMIAKRCEGM